MKIKHWQGYGCLNAKALKNTTKVLVVEVWGNHEYGLEINQYDNYGVYNWLVKRFKRNKTERDIQNFNIEDFYIKDENTRCSIEHAIYTINFKS